MDKFGQAACLICELKQWATTFDALQLFRIPEVQSVDLHSSSAPKMPQPTTGAACFCKVTGR